MMKKIIIAVVLLVVIAVGVLLFIPWGEYESKLDKSDITQDEEVVDSTGSVVPSLSLIMGEYKAEGAENSQAELLFDLEGLKKTKGAFENFSIDFLITEDYTRSSLIVTIEANSVNTGNGMRDEHLVEEDFFDVAKYPEISFKSSRIAQSDTGYVAYGALNLLDASKEIEVPFKHLGSGENKEGVAFEAFEGAFTFDRTAYGMEEESGVGNDVTVSFYCELIAVD